MDEDGYLTLDEEDEDEVGGAGPDAAQSPGAASDETEVFPASQQMEGVVTQDEGEGSSSASKQPTSEGPSSQLAATHQATHQAMSSVASQVV